MSYKRTMESVKATVQQELILAVEQWGLFHSQHEAYAVTLEEVEEAKAEMEELTDALDEYWSTVRCNHSALALALIKDIENTGYRLACEAIQVAAMAKKTRIMLEGE